MATGVPDRAVTEFRKWLNQSDWGEDYNSFIEEFFEFLRSFGGRSLLEIEKMVSRTVIEIARDACFEEFMVLDIMQPHRAMSSFLSETTQRFTADELDYLLNLSNTKASLYEVTEVQGKQEVTLMDLLMREESFEYVHHGLNRPLEIGEMVLARIIEIDEEFVLTPGLVVIPSDVGQVMVKSIHQMVADEQQALPEDYEGESVPRIVAFEEILPMVPRLAVNGWLLDCADTIETADSIMVQGGSELRLVTLSYPIRADISVLKRTLDKQKWLQPAPEVEGWIVTNAVNPESTVEGNLSIDGHRLIAFAMSEELGTLLQDRIEAAVGGMLGIPSIDRILPSELMRVIAADDRPTQDSP